MSDEEEGRVSVQVEPFVIPTVVEVVKTMVCINERTGVPMRRTVVRAHDDYYAISETVVLGRPEALVFRCNENGAISDFADVAGGRTYEGALESLVAFLGEQ